MCCAVQAYLYQISFSLSIIIQQQHDTFEFNTAVAAAQAAESEEEGKKRKGEKGEEKLLIWMPHWNRKS